MKKIKVFAGILILTMLTVGCADNGKNQSEQSTKSTDTQAEQTTESDSSAAEKDVFVFKKLSETERENFLELIDKKFVKNVNDLSITESQSDIKPAGAKWYSASSDYQFEGKLIKADNFEFSITEDFGFYEETVSGQEYLCLYFGVKSNSQNHRFISASVADFSDNVLSVDIVIQIIENADMALSSDIVLLKFDKSTLDGEINDLKVSFSLSTDS